MRIVPFLIGLCACGVPEPTPHIPGQMTDGGDLVLLTNGHVLTQAHLDAFTEGFSDTQLETMRLRGQMQGLLERLAIGTTLYELALERELHHEPDIAQLMGAAQREVLANAMLKRTGKDAITDESVQAFYDERKVQYARASVHTRQIVVPLKETADAIVGQLGQVEEADISPLFAELAAQHSIDPGTAGKGGDMGWFYIDGMLPEVSEPAFEADVGALLGPLESRFGWHIVQVLDRRELTPLDEARPSIEDQLIQQGIETFLSDLKQNLVIEWGPGYSPEELAPEVTNGD